MVSGIYQGLEINALKKNIQIAVAQGGVTYGVAQLNLDKPLNVSGNIYTNGRLGIGTTAPNVPLDVRGNAYISGTEQINSGVVMNGQSLPAVSSAGTGKMVFSNNQFQVSENGATFKALGGGSDVQICFGGVWYNEGGAAISFSSGNCSFPQ